MTQTNYTWPQKTMIIAIILLPATGCGEGQRLMKLGAKQGSSKEEGTRQPEEGATQVVEVPHDDHEETWSPFGKVGGRLLGGMPRGGSDEKEGYLGPGGGEKVRTHLENKPQVDRLYAANQYGFDIHHIDGDGNCLFRAVADQLQKPPFNINFPKTADYYHVMRKIAVRHIKANLQAYEYLFEEHGPDSAEVWCTKMIKNKEWGGYIALQAFADALQVTFVSIDVEMRGGKYPTVYKPYHFDPQRVMYLHYTAMSKKYISNGIRNHYEALSEVTSPNEEQRGNMQALKQYIKNYKSEINTYAPNRLPDIPALVASIAEISKEEILGKSAGEKDTADKNSSADTEADSKQRMVDKSSPDGSKVDSKHDAADKPTEGTQTQKIKQQQWWHTHQERYKTTADLVAALNQATDEQDRQGLCHWLQQYVDTFASKSAQGLVVSANSEAYLAEYATLSEIAPKDEPTAQLLLRYFNSILNKIPDQRIAAEECIMHLLVDTLSNIQPTIFKGNTAAVTALSYKLFARLKDLKSQDLHAGNYPAYSSTFEALYRAFDLLSDILGKQRWNREDKVYKRLKEKVHLLKEHIKKGGYYLFLHQLFRIEGSLKQLKERDVEQSHGAAWKRRAKRVGQGLGGLVRMLTSIRATVVPGVSMAQFKDGRKAFLEALHRKGLFKNKEFWLKQDEDLSKAMQAIYEGKAGALAAFTKKFRAFTQALPEPIGAEEEPRIVLSYDLVDKLLSLAHQSQAGVLFECCEELAKQLSSEHAKYSKAVYVQYAKDIRQALHAGFFEHLQQLRQAAPKEDGFYSEVLKAMQKKFEELHPMQYQAQSLPANDGSSSNIHKAAAIATSLPPIEKKSEQAYKAQLSDLWRQVEAGQLGTQLAIKEALDKLEARFAGRFRELRQSFEQVLGSLPPAQGQDYAQALQRYRQVLRESVEIENKHGGQKYQQGVACLREGAESEAAQEHSEAQAAYEEAMSAFEEAVFFFQKSRKNIPKSLEASDLLFEEISQKLSATQAVLERLQAYLSEQSSTSPAIELLQLVDDSKKRRKD